MARPALPIALPGGQLMPHMSARRRHEIMDTVFEMTGGVERLAHQVNKDDSSYWEFMKLWGKGLPRAVATEHSATAGVEQLLDKLDALDRSDNATVIDGNVIDIVE
jgi:hypothetical protein